MPKQTPNRRAEHARIADLWLAIPKDQRPSLWAFLQKGGYGVSQKSIQAELERRGLDRKTGEPLKEESQEASVREEQEEPQQVSGREELPGEQVLEQAVEAVEPVSQPTPQQLSQTQPKYEQEDSKKPSGGMVTTGIAVLALGMFAYWLLAPSMRTILGRSGHSGASRSNGAGTVATDSNRLIGYSKYSGRTQQLRTIDQL